MQNKYPEGSKFHLFYHTDSPFSQFHPSPFDGHSALEEFKDTVNHHFLTAEHYMHYYKALLFDDYATAARILESNTPGEAKRLGRTVRGFNEHRWDRVKEELVFEANVFKFKQNNHLVIKLFEAEGFFVEASPTDTVWGIGLQIDDPKCQNPAKWRGTNLLGRTLDRVKAHILAYILEP